MRFGYAGIALLLLASIAHADDWRRSYRQLETPHFHIVYYVFPKGGERSVTASLNEDGNTSFVPWLIGSIVVGTAITVGIVLLATPPDGKPVNGTLPPFKVGTQAGFPGFHF